ncbi:MAG TPA: mandelate racemase/muconate lactonizing enzyme family protein [Burkholderiaceae bacterium]|nr:mandelate racemase/muconate lactonizing enzyme family protein [Burkholderiaceae bacterium]
MTLKLRSLRALVYRCPIDTPVVTSFGTMRDRPMVLIRAEDDDGVVGWGESWCNFPAVGAEHRARLVHDVLAPIVVGVAFAQPEAAFGELTRRTEVLALQAGEPGPIAQAIAGVDTALWDLHARRRREPLWRLLGGSDPRVRVYASGLNPDAPERLAAARRAEGHRAFKLKIGFGIERDVANLRALRATLGDDAELMVDANQAWTPQQATEHASKLAQFGLRWLEEPLRADVKWPQWRQLRERCAIPLAAGENVAGFRGFDDAIAAGALSVIQPDLAKWGGVSGCASVARRVIAAGLRYCPHYLGGGIGLLASAHLLAAVGGDGMLEIDSNPNPLRTLLCGPLAQIDDGTCRLNDLPGLGVDVDVAAIASYSGSDR